MKRHLQSFPSWLLGMLGACLGVSLMVSHAAAAILCGITNINPIVNNGTVTVISAGFVTTVANQLVDIKYNAECAIAGGPLNYVNTNIIIDPAGAPGPFVCPPSNSDNALCSGNHTAAIDGWVSAVTNCVTRIPTTGVHTVRVQVFPSAAGTFWRIDDQSLKCEN